jgi:hypothetical protein
MPKTSGSSSKANIHPYLRADFIWPEEVYGNYLCRISDDDFAEKRIEEFRKKRTFYFNEKLCKKLGMDYYQKGQEIKVDKNVVFQIAINEWDRDHLSRWKDLKEQTIKLVNNGISWWTAETTWIKAKL